MGADWIGDYAPVSEIDLRNHSQRVGAVDALNWVTTFATGVENGASSQVCRDSEGRSVSHILGALSGIRKYIRAEIPLIFVYDGKISSEIRQMTDPNRSTKDTPYPQTKFYKRSLTQVLDALGIPSVMDYPFDGDAGAAMLNSEGYADFVLSDDWDPLLFGAETQIRNFTGRDPEELVHRRALEQETGCSREELIDVAIIVGTDYNDGLRNMSAASAFDALSMYGSLEAVYDRRTEDLPEIVDDLRELFLQPPSFEGVNSTLLENPPIPNPDLSHLKTLMEEYEIPSERISEEISALERTMDRSSDPN